MDKEDTIHVMMGNILDIPVFIAPLPRFVMHNTQNVLSKLKASCTINESN